eukprot:scaffold8194_cov94-Skeletonema_dohrnii-CCMP3373.AAC.1
MPSTTAQRAHNVQLVRPWLSELPTTSGKSYPRSRVTTFIVNSGLCEVYSQFRTFEGVDGMEVLDRIKRRFDGGDGDDVAKQNNQQNNPQRRESE